MNQKPCDGYYRTAPDSTMIYLRVNGKWWSMTNLDGTGLLPHSENLDKFIRERGLDKFIA